MLSLRRQSWEDTVRRRGSPAGLRLPVTGALILSVILSAIGCAPRRQSTLPMVGLVMIAPGSTVDQVKAGYVRGLADGGFVDGKTLRLRVRDAQGDVPTAHLITQELAAQRVDLIATITTPALAAALDTTKEIPVVFSLASPDVAGAGEPEAHLPNVTGATADEPLDAMVDLARRLVPAARTFGIIHDPAEAFCIPYLREAKSTAAKHGIRCVEIAVNNSSEVVTAVQALKARGADAWLIVPSNTVNIAVEGALREATKLDLPAISSEPDQSALGAVAALGVDMEQWGYAAGELAARILKGEKAAALPFTEVKERRLTVNPTAAARFGIRIPDPVLKAAHEVVGGK